MPQPVPLNVRFEAMIKRSDDGCWEWLGHKRNGYGAIKSGRPSRKSVGAHRVSYEMFVAPIPAKMLVLHTCDNPGCVRPDHLVLGCHADNSRDMALKGRSGRRKLNRDEAFALLWRDASGEPRSKLADDYGISYQAVRAIARRQNWQSLSHIYD